MPLAWNLKGRKADYSEKVQKEGTIIDNEDILMAELNQNVSGQSLIA